MTRRLERLSAWSLRLDNGKRVEFLIGLLTALRHNKTAGLLTLRQLSVLRHFEHGTQGRFFRTFSLYTKVNSKHDEYFL